MQLNDVVLLDLAGVRGPRTDCSTGSQDDLEQLVHPCRYLACVADYPSCCWLPRALRQAALFFTRP